jgi:hypothetical protein
MLHELLVPTNQGYRARAAGAGFSEKHFNEILGSGKTISI